MALKRVIYFFKNHSRQEENTGLIYAMSSCEKKIEQSSNLKNDCTVEFLYYKTYWSTVANLTAPVM